MEKIIIAEVEKIWNQVSGGSSSALSTKCSGDICVRVISKYIKKAAGTLYDVSEPNVFIKGTTPEFDLLVIRKGAKPIAQTSCYEPSDIISVIEVKSNGIYGGASTLPGVISRIKENFDKAISVKPDLKCAYISLQERSKPKKATSINYLAETKKYLAPYQAFFLRDSGDKSIIFYGQWNSFINEIL